MSYSSEVLADSPTTYWRLGTAAGHYVDSASGGARPLTKYSTNDPSDVAGLLASDSDGAVAFGGAGTDALQASDDSVFDVLNNQAFSIELWVKLVTNDATGRRLVSHENDTGSGLHGWCVLASSVNGFEFNRSVGGSTIADFYKPASYAGVAHHIVGTYDGSNKRLYVDGTLQSGPSADSAVMPNVAQPLILSTYVFGNPIQATLDEIAFYNGVALSAARVTAHYNAGLLTLDAVNPDADVTTTGWTSTPLYSKVNDSSDATVIQATAA